MTPPTKRRYESLDASILDGGQSSVEAQPAYEPDPWDGTDDLPPME